MAEPILTAARLRELLYYDALTGAFNWRETVGRRGKVGQLAGNVHSSGYVHIIISRVSYKAHRLAWLYMTGEWPIGTIDHRDTDRANNVWSNLRDVPGHWNTQNQSAPHKNNKSGFLGVTRQGNYWRSNIRVNGMAIFLGSFSTPEAAHERYLQEKRLRHPGALG